MDDCIDKWIKSTNRTLDIRKLKLKKWPKKLIGKEHLINVLYCSGNELASLPNGLINLEKLNCSNNKLICLPEDLVSLKYLYCAFNELTSLPKNLTELKHLYCSYNKLTDIPEEPKGVTTSLKELNCCNNKLTVLPKNLNRLKWLWCSNNMLTSIPKISNIEMFKCHNNQLFSEYLEYWEKIWAFKATQQKDGIKRVIKVLKNRSYLPRLDKLHQELIWSPNHPGKFFKLLPRVGTWTTKST